CARPDSYDYNWYFDVW
nr:immunoglobulin heavy chain junction region [Mus musculus]MBK4188155.1 immunoglobulin heavy chain junction region [Mus musculus]MBK4188156.1 immunoglobulin heavy chain junction region [Mus musculus]MBK4188157.1 immunoglobulin heavy chain junction region [Mus musculus]MBK4188158.1 immunoglobulin heavy chain junction region [Mus musculus]